MKNLLIAIMVLSCSLLTAQNIIEWKGGTPGNMNTWTEASNWSSNRVPDQFSHVIIKKRNDGHNSQPVLNTQIELASLTITSGANLLIDIYGEIKIDGRDVFTYGLLNYGGKITNLGVIKMFNLEYSKNAFKAFDIGGNGLIFLDGKLKNASYALK